MPLKDAEIEYTPGFSDTFQNYTLPWYYDKNNDLVNITIKNMENYMDFSEKNNSLSFDMSGIQED